MNWYTGLRVKCDECGLEATFENPHGHTPHVLEEKAVAAGWYVHQYANGKDLCPKHHTLLAAKFGLKSLFDRPHPIGILLDRTRDKNGREAEKEQASA